ncbi:MAG: hypothetical protein ACI9R8_001402 [Candidatus Paceibacteria bacterium]|jgi:hypothetical protein
MTARLGYERRGSDNGNCVFATPLDKGSEFDLRATLPINDSLYFGVKYAAFFQGDSQRLMTRRDYGCG